jgi:hypothetical protein
MPSFKWEVKPRVPCCKTLWHVKEPFAVKETLHMAKFIISFISLSFFDTRWLLVGLLETSGGRIRSFPLWISSHYSSPNSYITWGIKRWLVGGRSSETQSHPQWHDRHVSHHLINHLKWSEARASTHARAHTHTEVYEPSFFHLSHSSCYMVSFTFYNLLHNITPYRGDRQHTKPNSPLLIHSIISLLYTRFLEYVVDFKINK